MSKFLNDIKAEIKVRIQSYKARRKALLNAQVEIAELDNLIAEAEAELTSIKSRVPDEAVAEETK